MDFTTAYVAAKSDNPFTNVSTTDSDATTEETIAKELSCNPSQPSISSTELLLLIQNGSPSFKASMYVPFPLLIIMILFFVDLVIFHVKNSVDSKRTRYTLLVVSGYPVLGMMCVIGLYMPAAASVITFGSTVYFAFVLVNYTKLVINLYGGEEEAVRVLKGDAVVSANPFPCCFICCCRNQPMTLSRLKQLKWLCYQVLFFLPLFYFFQTLLELDGLLRRSVAAVVMSFLLELGTILANFTCLYGFVIIGKSARFALQEFLIRGKYIGISLVLAFDTIQGFSIRVVDFFDGLSCGFPYPDKEKAFLLHYYIFFYELFVISLLGWYFYRKPYSDCQIHVKKSTDPTGVNKNTFDLKFSLSENYASTNSSSAALAPKEKGNHTFSKDLSV